MYIFFNTAAFIFFCVFYICFSYARDNFLYQRLAEGQKKLDYREAGSHWESAAYLSLTFSIIIGVIAQFL